MLEHPLRYVIPPVLVVAGVWILYFLARRHAEAERDRPHDNPHKPVTPITASGVIAIVLILAFLSAFILP
jgi:multisubunit Na+/H+ antiporter MnhB subunit